MTDGNKREDELQKNETVRHVWCIQLVGVFMVAYYGRFLDRLHG